MAADPGGPAEPSRRRFAVLWFLAAVLVAGAAGALVLTDDPRLLRLGLVSGLWAALIGSFAASRQRLRALEAQQRLAEQQQKHVAELDREVAERREVELELQTRQQQQEAAETSSQVQRLRDEVHALRQALEQATEQVFGKSGVRGTSTRLDGGPPAGRGLAAVEAQQSTIPQPSQQFAGEPWFSAGSVQRFPERSSSAQQWPQFPPGAPAQQQVPTQTWPAEQPHRAPQRAAPKIGPSGSYGGVAHYSGTFSPFGEVSEPVPAGPEPGGAERPQAVPQPAGPAEHPPGAHSEGTAVVDLLAAYGNISGGAEPGDARNRRRRRS
jgi:hypothetical protein